MTSSAQTVQHEGDELRLAPWFVVDRDLVVRDVNLDACLAMDVSRRVLLGKRMSLFVCKDDGPKLVQAILSAGPWPKKLALRLRTRTGQLRAARVELMLDAEGEHILVRTRSLAA